MAVWIASVAAILFFPFLFVIIYAVATGMDLSDSGELTIFATKDPRGVFVQLLGTIPAHLLTLALALAVVTSMWRYRFKDAVGWSWGGVRFWHYVAFTVAFWIIALLVLSFFPEKEDEITRIIKSSRPALYLLSAIAVITAPIVEELVYRGIIFSAFLKRFGMVTAIFVATVLFTLVHIPQYLENPAKVFILLLLSLALTLLRAWTGSLLPSVILHTVINASQTAFLILEPYVAGPAPDTGVVNLIK
jgi:membrane protease YdiL (CAAX protease family)